MRVVAALPISVTDDVDGARKQAAEQFSMYGQLPSYRAMLDREGYAGPEDVAIIGDEATVKDRLDEVRAAGVDEYVAAPSMPRRRGGPGPEGGAASSSTPDDAQRLAGAANAVGGCGAAVGAASDPAGSGRSARPACASPRPARAAPP